MQTFGIILKLYRTSHFFTNKTAAQI